MTHEGEFNPQQQPKSRFLDKRYTGASSKNYSGNEEKVAPVLSYTPDPDIARRRREKSAVSAKVAEIENILFKKNSTEAAHETEEEKLENRKNIN